MHGGVRPSCTETFCKIMRYATIALYTLFLWGCEKSESIEPKQAEPLTLGEFSSLFSQELVTKYYDSGRKSPGEPDFKAENDKIVISYSGVTIEVGHGGSFFTEKDATEAEEGLFGVLFGEMLSPEIGSRAHIFGIEDDILIFTTSDERFDVRIEPYALTPEMDVVGIGKEVSEFYDKNRPDQKSEQDMTPKSDRVGG